MKTSSGINVTKGVNKLRKVALIRTAIGFILVGVFFVVVGGLVLMSPKQEYADVKGIIAEIEEYHESGSQEETDYRVYVDYEVHGVKYQHVLLGGYDSSMKEGQEVEFQYLVSDPSQIQYGSSAVIVIVVMVAGVLAIVLGIRSLVKNGKKSSEEFNQFDRVDVKAAAPEVVEELTNSTEPQKDYYFHFEKQGWVMENPHHEPVFTAKMEKFSLLGEEQFEFTDCLSADSRIVKLGKTVTRSVGVGGGNFSSALPISSSFTVDGVDVWDYLAGLGFGFDAEIQKGLKVVYHVHHYGVPAATLESAGTEILEKYEGSKNPLTKVPSKGLYRVSCKKSDMEAVFMICVALSRTDTTAVD